MCCLSALARLLLVGAVLGAASPALGARVAVLLPGVESDSAVSEGRRARFQDELTRGLRQSAEASTIVLPAEEVRNSLQKRPDLLSCTEGACLAQAARALQVDRIAVAKIKIKRGIGGSDYSVALNLYDQEGTATGVLGNETCERCNLTEVFAALQRTGKGIAGKLSNPVAAPPPVAPPPVAPPPAPEPPPAALAPPPMTPAIPPEASVQPNVLPYNRGYRIGWITAAAVAGAFIIASIPFLAFASKDGQTTCGDTVMRQNCPTVFQGNRDTGLGLLLGGGLASAGVFAVLFYLDRREMRRASGVQAALLPLPDGAGAYVAGRF